MYRLAIPLITLLLMSCKQDVNTSITTAQGLVDKSIEVSGATLFDSTSVIIKFDFRGVHYKSSHTADGKVLIRSMVKDTDTIMDFLRGNTFQRYVNEVPVKIEDSMIPKYAASVNSVHYFSILPYGLNDDAVRKKRLEEETIKGKAYQVIEVTFSEEGGGEDYDDVFLYWINNDTYKADYLAYSYNEDDGKGLRFRAAYNERYVNGLRFVDYNNYKPKSKDVALRELGQLYAEDNLQLLSKIELTAVKVDTITNQ